MMVLLSTVAVSQQFSGIELVLSVLKLIFFLTIWFVMDIFHSYPTQKSQTLTDG
jgi:CPA2 family monovalent cation:H+ antiporter-2